MSMPPLRGERIRTMVVCEAAALRQFLVGALRQDPAIEVVGSEPRERSALDAIAECQPAVVLLNVAAPSAHSLETLRRIRQDFPHLRVVTFHSPAGTLAALGDALIANVKQAVPAPPAERPKLVLLGISTGGPDALAAVLPLLPADFALPVLIVQHMPARFTGFLCDRLRPVVNLPIGEALDGEPLAAPKILIAPGDFHMRIAPSERGAPARIALDRGPLENACRPAVDALFCSAAQLYGGAVLAIVMTGMGQDGLRGARALRSQGASIIAQDEASSAVWGMPRAVIEAGLADLILPLDRIIPEVLRLAAPLAPPAKSRRAKA